MRYRTYRRITIAAYCVAATAALGGCLATPDKGSAPVSTETRFLEIEALAHAAEQAAIASYPGNMNVVKAAAGVEASLAAYEGAVKAGQPASIADVSAAIAALIAIAPRIKT